MQLSDEFVTLYRRFTEERQRGAASPADELRDWEDFVEECEEGYGSELSEFDFDLAVRDDIQKMLDDPTLRRTRGYDDFSGAVAAIDRRFRNIATVDIPTADTSRLPWWQHRLPAKGGQVFVHDVRVRCGLVIALA
ncbi:hypothetical protein ACWERV_13345 [Streptomyces sp. NPDC004031]